MKNCLYDNYNYFRYRPTVLYKKSVKILTGLRNIDHVFNDIKYMYITDAESVNRSRW